MKVSGELHDPSALPPGTRPLYTLSRYVGTHSLSGRFREEKNLLVLLINKPNDGHSFAENVLAVGRLEIEARLCCQM